MAVAPMDNVTISLKGMVAKDVPMDFTFTTAGPTFKLDQIISQVAVNGNLQPVIGTCQVTIVPLAAGYRIQYSVGARIPVITSSSVGVGSQRTNAVTSTVTFQSITFAGSVILKAGQPVTILNSDGQDVTITLTKPASS